MRVTRVAARGGPSVGRDFLDFPLVDQFVVVRVEGLAGPLVCLLDGAFIGQRVELALEDLVRGGQVANVFVLHLKRKKARVWW